MAKTKEQIIEQATSRLIKAIPGSDTCYSCPVASLRRGSSEGVVNEALEEVAMMTIAAESLKEGRDSLKHTPGSLPPLQQRFVANCLLKRAQGHCPSYQGELNA